ncbi:MAG: AEC family transporter [Bdellovibrionales bacterium]
MTEALINAVIPLFVLMGLGFTLGRVHKIDATPIAITLIFGVTPIVALFATAQIEFAAELLLLPVVGFCLATLSGLITHFVGYEAMPDNKAHFLLAHAAGAANTGYMGLPIVIALFDAKAVGLYILMTVGHMVYESTIGYYFIARGRLNVRDALIRIVRLPAIYAIMIGIIISALNMAIPAHFIELWKLCKGAYVVFGMAFIGIALAQYGLQVDGRLLAMGGIGKLVLQPLLAFGAIMLDATTLHLFDTTAHQLLLIMTITPSAANLAAFAVKENVAPDRAAAYVLLITIIALLSYPFVLPWLLAQLPA